MTKTGEATAQKLDEAVTAAERFRNYGLRDWAVVVMVRPTATSADWTELLVSRACSNDTARRARTELLKTVEGDPTIAVLTSRRYARKA